MRDLGTVVKGIRTPIIKEDTDLMHQRIIILNLMIKM